MTASEFKSSLSNLAATSEQKETLQMLWDDCTELENQNPHFDFSRDEFGLVFEQMVDGCYFSGEIATDGVVSWN